MRKIKESTFEYKANSKDFLEALINNVNYCKLLKKLKPDQSYDKLLNWIINYNAQQEEEVLIPDLKLVYKLAGISYSHIGTNLRDIYYDIFKLNVNNPRKFSEANQKLCILSMNYFDNIAYFRMGLDVIPNIGNKFILSFIKPILGNQTFWIKNIIHEIYDGYQLVTVEMTEYNPNIIIED